MEKLIPITMVNEIYREKPNTAAFLFFLFLSTNIFAVLNED